MTGVRVYRPYSFTEIYIYWVTSIKCQNWYIYSLINVVKFQLYYILVRDFIDIEQYETAKKLLKYKWQNFSIPAKYRP